MAEFDGEPSGPLGTRPGSTDIVQEARERFELCLAADDRSEAMDDLRFLLGGENQWDAEAVISRNLDNKPCLTDNDIPAILHQVTNDARQNKQSIHVAPVDSEADPKVAELLGGLIRHIEYDSDADAAYDTALEGAARIGFGYFRLVTEYSDPLSFDQDIKIKRIRNPFTVYIDPDAQEADGSDMRFAFVSSKIARTEFDRLYPGRSAGGDGIGTATGDNATWVGKDYVRLAEYYRIEHEPDTLYLLGDGQTILKSDKAYNAAMMAVSERDTFTRKVMWYKLNGYEVLEKAEIACPWIPIFPVYGDEIDIDGIVTRNGLIRNAKDPKKRANFWVTSATEEIAMRTKTPWIGALGQFEGLENDWDQANVRNFAYLEYNPITIDGTLAPAPQRQPPADVPSGYIQMMIMSRDAVKAVTGIYDASLGNRSNEVSGIAINQRKQQGELGNFHFTDNLTRAITRMAKCIIAMIPRIYDTNRVVRILGEDRKTAKFEPINKPTTEVDEQGQAIETILNDLTVGTYDVTVSTGPAYQTMRQETVANMVEMGSKWPELMAIAGDEVIENMDWPGARKTAERVKRWIEKTNPGIVEDEDKEQEPMVQTPNGPIPLEQAGQMIGQLDQTVQAMQEELDKAQSGIEKANIDAAAKVRVAEMGNEGRLDVEELKGMITLLTAQITPMLAHQAAVVAAADPEHPDTPAPIAQNVEEAPAAIAARDAETEASESAAAPTE